MKKNTADSPLKPVLDNLALFLLITYIVYRTFVSSLNNSHSSNFFASSLVLIGASVWLLARIFDGGFTFRAHWMDAAVFGLLAACALSIGSAVYVLIASEFALGLSATVLVLYMGAHAFGRPRASLVMTIFLSLTTVIVLYGLLQRFVLLKELLSDPSASQLMSTPDGRERIEKMQPFSVFLNPNQFGMYCAIASLILAGSLLDARAFRNRHAPFKAGLIVLSLVALFFTSSKGAWLALAVGIGFMVYRLLPGRWSWGWLGVGAAIGIGGVIALSNTPSMQIRYAYWDAAWDIAWLKPATGIGLYNYQDYHSQYKEVFAPDVKLVHNDYLQLLCELGILGFACIVAFGAGLIRRLGWGSSEPAESRQDNPWIPGAAIAVGTLMAWGLDGQFAHKAGATLALIILVVAVMIYYWRRNMEEEILADPKGLRLGLAAAVVAFMAHMLVDFDWYEHAFLTPFFLMAGLGIALGGKSREVAIDRTLVMLVAAFLLVVTLVGGIYPSSKLMPTDSRKNQAARLIETYKQSKDLQDLVKAAKTLEEGAGVHQWDPDLHARLADVYLELAREIKPRDAKEALKGLQAPPDSKDKEVLAAVERVRNYSNWMSAGTGHIEMAVTLRERHEGYRIRLAEMLMERGDYVAQIAAVQPDPTMKSQQQVIGLFQFAVRHLDRAEELAPDLAYVQFLIGEATRKMGGREKEVASRFKKAKELHDKTTLYYRKLNQAHLIQIEEFLKR